MHYYGYYKSKTSYFKTVRKVWAVVSTKPNASYREIRDAARLSSTSVVGKAIRHLEALGYIERGPARQGRTLRVLVPFVGTTKKAA